MTEEVKPFSPKDIAFMKQQVTIATIAICVFGVFFMFVIYMMFQDLIIVQGIAFVVVLIGAFFIRKTVVKKFLTIVGDNLKVVLSDAVVTNRDIEIETKRRTSGKSSSTWYKYFLYFEEYKIEVGCNQYEKYDIGTHANVEFTKGGNFLLNLEKSQQ